MVIAFNMAELWTKISKKNACSRLCVRHCSTIKRGCGRLQSLAKCSFHMRIRNGLTRCADNRNHMRTVYNNVATARFATTVSPVSHPASSCHLFQPAALHVATTCACGTVI